MKKGLILAGEPMGLLIAQSEGDLSGVSGYDLAVAGAEFTSWAPRDLPDETGKRSVRRAHHPGTERERHRE